MLTRIINPILDGIINDIISKQSGANIDYDNITFTLLPYDMAANGTNTGVVNVIVRDLEGITLTDVNVVVELIRSTISASLSVVTANPGSINNDGLAQSIIFITVKDAEGNPLSGIPSSAFSVISSGLSNTITAIDSKTDEDGIITYSLVSTNSETKIITITVHLLAITDTATVIVAPISVTTFASSDFSSGNISPFTNPWGTGITIISDPTASGRGNVAQMQYSPSSGGSVERGVVWSPSPTVRYGREVWFKGDVYILDSSGSDPDWNNNDNRKLIDWQGTNTRLTLNRRDGVLRISCVDRMSGTETEVVAESTGITLLKDTWYTLDVRMVTNSADGVRDGIVEIYVNGSGTPSYTRTTGLGWITENGVATSFRDFIVGFQLTIDSGNPTYTDTRYWDNIFFSDGRLPLVH